MKADEKTREEVLAVLDRLNEGYAAGDLEGMAALYTTDPDLVAIGTGKDEKFLGLEAVREGLERDFAQSESVAIEVDWSSVSARGDVAWLAAETTARVKAAGGEMTIPARLTMVLEKRDGRWLIAQFHLSMAMPEQAAGESFPG
ncbi:MAG: nuclear transport factor 2 family protein [PVC group bacterium]